jgi:hypothetical protein
VGFNTIFRKADIINSGRSLRGEKNANANGGEKKNTVFSTVPQLAVAFAKFFIARLTVFSSNDTRFFSSSAIRSNICEYLLGLMRPSCNAFLAEIRINDVFINITPHLHNTSL